ncbi:uncharacterized protein LACBIDRAFT_295308 [Laccaria bicolor S238N-H82]|uniref:Predicted protein n=1 Tax=Laccaria bicolor (strain S238N-H82 / ATCC MYA-4686) TaxID=486041 RepID=B0DQB0_LACBS|nr:uncharacterized protein LACBIDRAFT_295308 [Laccaria bicolor S238N-H82]EDR03353.1 predicted protein [Laccaria bicolor S238N-H82]|eukprot:XP_001886149.1 predicted protein [Laccaria bicolor S238N-H82]
MIFFRRNGPLPSFSLALSSFSFKSSSLMAEGDSTSYSRRDGSPSRSLMRTIGRHSQETYEFSRSFFLVCLYVTSHYKHPLMVNVQPDSSFMSDADSDFETEFGDWDDRRSIQTVFDDQPTKNRSSSLRRFLSAFLRKWPHTQKYNEIGFESHTAKLPSLN